MSNFIPRGLRGPRVRGAVAVASLVLGAASTLDAQVPAQKQMAIRTR